MCMFGNDMELNKQQVKFLDAYCGTFDDVAIKFYVHRLTSSCVVDYKCKMVRLCYFCSSCEFVNDIALLDVMY